MTKKCNKCTRDLPIHAFNKDRSTLDGLQRKCRICQKGVNEDYRRSIGMRAQVNFGGDARRIYVTLPNAMIREIDRNCLLSEEPRSAYIRDAIAERLRKG